MIENVRNKFATIFRRSVLFMRNSALCFPFDAYLLLFSVDFSGADVEATFKCTFSLACQLPSEKERFHVFVCRVTFVCHCFAMCTFASILLFSLPPFLRCAYENYVGIHLASLCLFLCHCICATNGQNGSANNEPLAHSAVFHAYLMPLAVPLRWCFFCQKVKYQHFRVLPSVFVLCCVLFFSLFISFATGVHAGTIVLP